MSDLMHVLLCASRLVLIASQSYTSRLYDMGPASHAPMQHATLGVIM